MSNEQRLTREDIIREVNLFRYHQNLYTREVVVGYGAAMVLHGFHEDTGDIDIDLSYGIFERISQEYGLPVEMKLMGEGCDITEVISIHGAEFNDGMIEIIDDIAVYTFDVLLEQKLIMSRHKDRMAHKVPQDLKDIEEIDKRLKLKGV